MSVLSSMRTFRSIDYEIWPDAETNPYLGTLVILLSLLLGACVSGGNTLHQWFGWDTTLSLYKALSVTILAYGAVLAESIMATQRALDALLRSLMYLGGCAVSFGLGYLLATIILAIIAIYFVIQVIIGTVSTTVDDMLHPNSSSAPDPWQNSEYKEKVKLEDGTWLTKENSGWHDESGHEWEERYKDKFERK